METTAEIPAPTSPIDSLNPKNIVNGIIKTKMKIEQNCKATVLLWSGMPKLRIILLNDLQVIRRRLFEILIIFFHRKLKIVIINQSGYSFGNTFFFIYYKPYFEFVNIFLKFYLNSRIDEWIFSSFLKIRSPRGFIHRSLLTDFNRSFHKLRAFILILLLTWCF